MNYEIIEDMFPKYLRKTNIECTKDKIIISFSSIREECVCPSCSTPSTSKMTYFTRRLQDLNIIEKPLFLEIRLAKYRCINPECKVKIFSEELQDFADSKARRTNRLNELLTQFALTESAESASRKCENIGIRVSGDTLLRLAKKWEPEINKESIVAIGIDDFAFKKNILMEP